MAGNLPFFNDCVIDLEYRLIIRWEFGIKEHILLSSFKPEFQTVSQTYDSVLHFVSTFDMTDFEDKWYLHIIVN